MAAGDLRDAAAGGRASGARRYAAFISYSHADEEFGDWLHRRLESYQAPASLIGRPGPNGPIGKRLGKVFRDRQELSAAHDLAGEIREGLNAADALIVLCSPRSCRSKYVHEEIRYFKELGKGNRIFAAIVDGEPHAAGKPGRTSADECFPPALIYRLGSDGQIADIPEPTETLAADFREGKDGRENGALKIIAGLLDVGLDELVQRERQAERRRRMRANAIAGAMAMLALGAASAGGYAWVQRNLASVNAQRAEKGEGAALVAQKLAQANEAEAIANAREAERQGGIASENAQRARSTLNRFFATRAWEKLDAGDTIAAAQYALAGLRLSPENAEDMRTVLGAAIHQSGDIVASIPVERYDRVEFSADGRALILSNFSAKSIRIGDVASGGRFGRTLIDASLGNYQCGQSTGGVIVYLKNDKMALLDPATGKVSRLPTRDAEELGGCALENGRALLRDKIGWRLVDLGSGALLGASAVLGDVSFVAASRNGSHILYRTADRVVLVDMLAGAEKPLALSSDKCIRGDADAYGRFYPRGYVGGVFSADGARVVVLCPGDRVAREFDVATGEQVAASEPFKDELRKCAYSVTGGVVCIGTDEEFHEDRISYVSTPYLARIFDSGGGARTIVLADLMPRRAAAMLRPGGFDISSDGRWLALGQSNSGVAIIDLQNQRLETFLRGFRDAIGQVVFSADSSEVMARPANEGMARVWITPIGWQRGRLPQYSGYIHARLTISANGAVMGARAADFATNGDVPFWFFSVKSGQVLGKIGSAGAGDACLSPDGSRALVVGDRDLQLYETANARSVANLGTSETFVEAQCFSRDSRRFVTRDDDLVQRLYNGQTGALIAKLDRGLASFARNVPWVWINRGNGSSFWRLEDGAKFSGALFTDLPGGPVLANIPPALSVPDDNKKRLVLQTYDGAKATTKVLTEITYPGLVDSRTRAKVAASEDRALITRVSPKGDAIEVWDANARGVIARYSGAGLRGDLSEDGRTLLLESGFRDADAPYKRTFTVHHLDGKAPPVTFSVTAGNSLRLSFLSRDVIIGIQEFSQRNGEDRSTLWDANSGRVVGLVSGAVNDISDDGRILVTLSANKLQLFVWSLKDARLLATLPTPSAGGLYAATFLPGHRWLQGHSETSSWGRDAWNLAAFTAPLDELVANACSGLLADKDRRFTQDEIDADPLLRETWSNQALDVCDSSPPGSTAGPT